MINSNPAAFDYESSENNTVSQPNMPNTTNHQTPAAAGQSSSYVSVAKSLPKPTFPKKNQAIVLHAEDNLKLFDYVKAIGDIIGAKHITFASKISNNRICIYLSCPNDVDELLKTNPTTIRSYCKQLPKPNPNPQTQNLIIQPQDINTNSVTPAFETDNNIQPQYIKSQAQRDHPKHQPLVKYLA
ncbi:hypothetical protein JTB14_008105 [Gonioctena quinquepunctata]|nr:hypothetical protein JTB14_008105 [Gonioctena quinquepunctata]